MGLARDLRGKCSGVAWKLHENDADGLTFFGTEYCATAAFVFAIVNYV